MPISGLSCPPLICFAVNARVRLKCFNCDSCKQKPLPVWLPCFWEWKQATAIWCFDLTFAAHIYITAINAHPDQSVMLGSDHCCPHSHHCNQCTPRSKCDAWIWPLLPVFASLQSMHTPIKVWCLDLTIAARIRITATATRPKGPERLHKQDGTPRRVCLQVGTSSDKTVPTLGACTRI